MDTFVSLANWRTAPYSTQSFCNVDQLIPVSRIHAPGRVGELAVDSQSLTGATAGLLVDRGLLDPDRPVIEYVPEVADSAYDDCTVRHVLDVTVSSTFSEGYLDVSGDYIRYRRATLWDPAQPPSRGLPHTPSLVVADLSSQP